jgi:hypothetical protein
LNDLNQLIDRLKEELGPVADFLTEAVIKQVWVGGVMNVLLVLFGLALMWATWRWFVPWSNTELEKADRYSKSDWVFLRGMGVSLSLLIGVPIVFYNLFMVLQRIINPEWVAIALFRGLVS